MRRPTFSDGVAAAFIIFAVIVILARGCRPPGPEPPPATIPVVPVTASATSTAVPTETAVPATKTPTVTRLATSTDVPTETAVNTPTATPEPSLTPSPSPTWLLIKRATPTTSSGQALTAVPTATPAGPLCWFIGLVENGVKRPLKICNY